MKKLLLAFFVFSFACSANASDWNDANDVYRSLKTACEQCGGDSSCKAQVNLKKSDILVNHPDLGNAHYSLKFYKCY